MTSKTLIHGSVLLLAYLSAAPAAAQQSKAEHAAWATVGYALGTGLVAGSAYAIGIDGQCIQQDALGCSARLTQPDWQLGLSVTGIIFGVAALVGTTWFVADTKTYGWRFQGLPHASLEPTIDIGAHGGRAGLRIRW